MRIGCVHIAPAALLFAAASVWCQEGQGLDPTSDWLAGRWQARVELNRGPISTPYTNPYNIAAHARGAQRPGFSVLGDFFFKSPATETPSASLRGFRATSGLMIGSRNFGTDGASAAPHDGKYADAGPVPYFGVGYTDLPNRTGWGFKADFGLMAMNPRSAVKFGSVLAGPQSVDELLRDLRLSPLFQLGVSYSF